MNVEPTGIPEVLVVKPRVFGDPRGFFMESYNERRYRAHGIDRRFVQDNLSFSKRGTLRGLHFQVDHPQAKLVHVVAGEVFDVAVDIRPHSPNFGRWAGVVLSETNRWQLFVPEGFAHGFCVLSETAYFTYKCSDFYRPEDEGGILWSDPELAIEWPVETPIVSERDGGLPPFSSLRTTG